MRLVGEPIKTDNVLVVLRRYRLSRSISAPAVGLAAIFVVSLMARRTNFRTTSPNVGVTRFYFFLFTFKKSQDDDVDLNTSNRDY